MVLNYLRLIFNKFIYRLDFFVSRGTFNIILLIIPFFYLLPVLPNGSLFTSWNGAFFWFSLGLSLSLSEKIIQTGNKSIIIK